MRTKDVSMLTINVLTEYVRRGLSNEQIIRKLKQQYTNITSEMRHDIIEACSYLRLYVFFKPRKEVQDYNYSEKSGVMSAD